ncbi:uncharacterized protein LTR77_003753 [Saxophila tyrrhenica]|uniref:Amino acid permease/ SLC12A domain-containing protein n=1 Tax=Saxophila tyrrhenica TaxID=1690608 RepID=A0AAV9PEZ6_9PEZI|nr:hypothetical protein LTR77_003753 [Saxophila tyrrhenica]
MAEEMKEGSAMEPTEVDTKEHLAVTSHGTVVDHGLHRQLKSRHMRMISLGGVIGASIWYGVGVSIASSGPVGALVCFIVIGIDVFFVMQSIGEMSTLYPSAGAFTELAGIFIDGAVAVALGWNYWYLWAINLAAEYNLIAIVLSYWTDKVPAYAWILLFWAFYQVIGLLGIIVYGEVEFWLATIKIVTVGITMLLSILVNTGAMGGDYIGFRYWAEPGPVINGINGFGQSFVLAAVYYSGTELVAVTAGESRRPSKDVPSAIKQSLFRIIIIYWGLMSFAGISVSAVDEDLLTADSRAGSSPFAIMLVRAGYSWGGHLINAFIFFATFSASNSSIYLASRTLKSLADQGRAPRFFGKTHLGGVPVYAAVASNAVGLIALTTISEGGGKVFGYLVNLIGAGGLIVWSVVGITHLRFRRAWRLQGHTPDELPFHAFLYPYGAWIVAIFNPFLVFIQGYGTLINPQHWVDFVIAYIILVLFFVIWAGWKIWHRTKVVDLATVDLQEGRREVLAADDDEEQPGLFQRTGNALRARWGTS